MAFLISSFQRTQPLRFAGVLPKVIKPSLATQDSGNFRKYVMSPEEANLTAKFNELNLNKFQIFQAPTLIRLPTLDKNKTITDQIPLSKPCIEDCPSLNILEHFDPLSSLVIEEPATSIGRMEAARLIVIRRKKMKKHQRKKLRKKMRFVILKYVQKKEYQKEKLFQASQMAKIREAHAFDPVKYVNDAIAKTKEKPFPTRWKGRLLPKEIIMNIMANNGRYKPPKPQE